MNDTNYAELRRLVIDLNVVRMKFEVDIDQTTDKNKHRIQMAYTLIMNVLKDENK